MATIVKVSYQIGTNLEQESIRTDDKSSVLWEDGLLTITCHDGLVVCFNQRFVVGYNITEDKS